MRLPIMKFFKNPENGLLAKDDWLIRYGRGLYEAEHEWFRLKLEKSRPCGVCGKTTKWKISERGYGENSSMGNMIFNVPICHKCASFYLFNRILKFHLERDVI